MKTNVRLAPLRWFWKNFIEVSNWTRFFFDERRKNEETNDGFFKANLADIIDYSFNGYCDAVIPLVRRLTHIILAVRRAKQER